jgi:hypothetical protein
MRDYAMTVRVEIKLDMDSYNKKYGEGSEFAKKYGPPQWTGDEGPDQGLGRGHYQRGVLGLVQGRLGQDERPGGLTIRMDRVTLSISLTYRIFHQGIVRSFRPWEYQR